MTMLQNHSAGTLAASVISELESLALPPTPHVFAVWYAHVAGHDPALSAAIRSRQTLGQALTADVIEELHQAHIQNAPSAKLAEQSSRAVVMEIDAIVDLIRTSLGSTSDYSQKLSSLLGDMVTANDPTALKEIVATLVKSTDEARSMNETLEKGLRNARKEVDDLRKVLEDTRLETLQDALTGISNRKHFEQAIHAAVESASRSRRPFSLLMIDIDFFKKFNDTFGHLTGDKVLRVVAQTLRERFPTRATVARFGGEEFAVILPDADLMAGWVGAEAARQSMQARELVKRSTGEKMGRISISIGVGTWKRNDSAVTLVGRADQALMLAKANGRNRTVTEAQTDINAVA
jgi:diguanylate cyclase